jgi:hypothetical protein
MTMTAEIMMRRLQLQLCITKQQPPELTDLPPPGQVFNHPIGGAEEQHPLWDGAATGQDGPA